MRKFSNISSFGDSTNFKRRKKDDYGTKRVLNFDSVVNERNELINIKNDAFQTIVFINKI